MNRPSLLRNNQGFTLVELVILLVIAAIVLPGLMVYFINSMRHSAEAQVETVALGLAQELIEEVKAKPWDEHSPIPKNSPLVFDTGGGNYSIIGAEGAEARCDPTGCEAFDDLDDYAGLDSRPPKDPHGNDLTAYAAYRQRVSVCYVTEVRPVLDGGNGDSAGACVAGPTNYKMITAAIQWGANDQEQIQLQAVVANYRVN